MKDFTAVILAAGEGSRMKSKTPKVMHKICGIPILSHVIRAARKAGASRIVIVVGKNRQIVQDALTDQDIEFVVQEQQLGTGHALMQAKEVVGENSTITVLYGDMPVITAESISSMVDFHRKNNADATVMTAIVEDPTGYGRIIRENEKVKAIREEKDASLEEKAIKEINSGFYCFDSSQVFKALSQVKNNNRQGEYYLTDVVEILNLENKDVLAFKLKDPDELNGVNDRRQLAHVQRIIQQRIVDEHMKNGVTFINPEQVKVDVDVEIGQDSILYPGVILEGNTKIGQGCTIIGQSRIVDSILGNDVIINLSHIEGSQILDGVKIGPYSNIRPDCVIGPDVKIGDFVEVKNSSVGQGTKIPHLSYIGDSDIGRNVNIGAGVIFVNYDGIKKHHSLVQDNAFIGCNSNLIAPAYVGKGAFIAAGSTITDEVPEESLAIARSKQENKEGWVRKRKDKLEGGN